MVADVPLVQRWVRARDAPSPFLWLEDRCLTYGDVTGAGGAETGQSVVEPGSGLEAIRDLMILPGPAQQLVLIDPRLPEAEKRRRRSTASAAAHREALTVIFTSGTTGTAKAVRLTEGNWRAAVRASAEHLAHGPEDVWLVAMPLHHVGGLSILYRSAFVGASVRWVPDFDPARVAEELRGRVTIASLVPTMLRRLLDHDRAPYRGLRAVLVGGGPIPGGLLEEAHGRGLPVLPTYGMTETCAQVATLRPGSPPRYAAHLLPGVEMRIGPGERIEIRGAQVSPGYADEDDRPPRAWFRTADRGTLEDDRAVVVLGRADRVIVTGGENVDPARVESVLVGHPRVDAVAVVGVEDSEWGMAVAAVYTGAIDPEVLRQWSASHLAPHERPRMLRLVDHIPTVGPGKPDRARIEEILTFRPPG